MSSLPESSWIKVGIVRHADKRPFRCGRGADAPIGFLVDVEPDETLDEGIVRAQGGNDLVDPFGLVSTNLRGGHLSDHDRFFLGCKEGVDVLENLLEGLPAAVGRTPVVPIDPGPINVGIAWVVVHRVFVAAVDIRDVWTPYPDHVGCPRGNEEVVNV